MKVPAIKDVAVSVACAEKSSHKYEYGKVPSDAVTVAEPVAVPLQLTFVCAVIDDVNNTGSVIVTDVKVLQLFASFTVTV